MPYSITTRDGITIQNIPDDVPPDAPELKQRVAAIRASGGAGALAPPPEPSTTVAGVAGAATRGMALPAAGAVLGAAAGAPLAGVGAVPGALAGAAAGGLVQFVGDPIVSTVNNLLGTKYTLPTQAMEDLLTRIGVAQPKTEAERIVQATAAGAAGGGGSAALGRTVQTIAGQAAPVAREVGRMMAAQPAAQVVGGAGAGGAAQFAKEEGVGPVGQIGAGLVGGVAGVAGVAGSPALQRGAQAAGTAIQQGAQAVGRAAGILPAESAALDAVSQTASALQRGSVGASGLAMGTERAVRAEMMPVPFTGPSALTAGQASRNFSQLQFEKESAKLPQLGAPLRERVENQTANLIRNFDALIDMPNPVAADPRAIGMGVDRALVNRVEVERRRVRSAYEKAEAEGAMRAPVELAPLAQQLAGLSSLEGLVPTIPAVRREAVRLGALVPDQNGNLVPQQIDLKTSETLRQFVNASTDWTDRREALVGRQINASIDAATEGVGGEAYRAARKLRERFANEFENVGLTAKLLGTRRGTDERQVAFADVFDKVIISSPVEEMNKLRSTLLRSGQEGQQAWADLKAGGIRFIKDSSLSPSQRDSSGNPLLSPDKLQRTLRSLDQDGKLEALYGKRQAQVLRDLGDIATDIYTAPPGAVNHSNTASALMIALDTIGTAAFTGLPAPAVTALREANRYVRDRKTRARIEAALRGQVTAD